MGRTASCFLFLPALLLTSCVRLGFGLSGARDGGSADAVQDAAVQDAPVREGPGDLLVADDGANDGHGAPDLLPKRTCYCDDDADKHYSLAPRQTSSPSCAAAGCQDTPGDDCCDLDPAALPGAGYHEQANLCGTWDWDCSGTVDRDPRCFSCSGVAHWGSGSCPSSSSSCAGTSCVQKSCGESITRIKAVEHDATCGTGSTYYTNKDTLTSTQGWASCGLVIGTCVGTGCSTFPPLCVCK